MVMHALKSRIEVCPQVGYGRELLGFGIWVPGLRGLGLLLNKKMIEHNSLCVRSPSW